MSDLISREKTLYRLATSAVYYFDLKEDQAAHNWAMHIVSGMPDEEPEIVRCINCKFVSGDKQIADGRYWCKLHNAYMYYCSDAERQTDTHTGGEQDE